MMTNDKNGGKMQSFKQASWKRNTFSRLSNDVLRQSLDSSLSVVPGFGVGDTPTVSNF